MSSSRGVQVVDDLTAPLALDAMGRALGELALAPHVPAVGIHDEYDRRTGRARGFDEPCLRSDERLVAGQDHGPALFAELVEHVDDENRCPPGVDNEGLVAVLLRGKDVKGHGPRSLARRPLDVTLPSR